MNSKKMPTKTFLLLTTMSAILSCKTTSNSSKDKDIMIDWDPINMELGSSYNLITNTLIQSSKCVEGEEVDSKFPAANKEVNIQFFNDESTAASALEYSNDSSINAEIRKIGSLDIKGSIMKSIKSSLKNNTKWALMHIKVVTSTKKYKDAKITADYLKFLKDPNKDEALQKAEFVDAYQNRFGSNCGNAYLSSVEYGGEIFGVMKVNEANAETQEDLKMKLSTNAAGKVIGKSGKVDSSSNVSNTSSSHKSNYNAEVKAYIVGGSLKPNDGSGPNLSTLNFDDFVKLASKFPDAVRDGGANPIKTVVSSNLGLISKSLKLPVNTSKIGITSSKIDETLINLNEIEKEWLKLRINPSALVLTKTIDDGLARVAKVKSSLKDTLEACLLLNETQCVAPTGTLDSLQPPKSYKIQVTTKAVVNNIDDGFLFWGGTPECEVKYELCNSQACLIPQYLYSTKYKKWGECNLNHTLNFTPSEMAAKFGRYDEPQIDDLWMKITVNEDDSTAWTEIASTKIPLKSVLSKPMHNQSVSNDQLTLDITAKVLSDQK